VRFRFGSTKVGVESEFEGGNLGIGNGFRCFFLPRPLKEHLVSYVFFVTDLFNSGVPQVPFHSISSSVKPKIVW